MKFRFDLSESRALVTLSLALALFTSVSCSKYREMVAEDRRVAVEKAIAEKPEFQKLDTLCREIPLPEGTRFVEKARLYDSIGISYYYYSKKSPEELEEHFLQYFKANGWTPIKGENSPGWFAGYYKDDLELSVTFSGVRSASGDGNFGIGCELRTRN